MRADKFNIYHSYGCVILKNSSESVEKYGLPPDSVETFITLLKSKYKRLQEELTTVESAKEFGSQSTTVVATNLADEETKLTPELKETVIMTNVYTNVEVHVEKRVNQVNHI